MLSRPLPRSLDPLPDEGLDGFLLRLSYRLERTPYQMALLTGLIQRSGAKIVPVGLLFDLPGGKRRKFAYATRLSLDEVAGLCLSSMANHYPPTSPTPKTRGWAGSQPPGNHWVFKRATRYCPQCLAGDGSAIQNDLGGPWRKTWRLAVVFACTKHTRLLQHLCAGCARPVHDAITARGASNETSLMLIPQPGRSDLRPTQCRLPLASDEGHSRDLPTCDAELSGPPADPNAALAECEAIDLQKRINNLVDPSTSSAAVSCGLPTAASQYFIDLRLITHLIRASWPRAQDLLKIPEASSAAISQDHRHEQRQDRHGRRIRRTIYDVPPLDAKACAALLITADRLLQCERPDLLTEHLRHLLSYEPRSPTQVTWSRHIVLGQPDCSPGLRHALAPILQAYTPLPAGRARGTLQTPIRKTRYKPEHIAEFLQDDWYQRYFAHMDGIRPRHLRRAAAIHLCQIAVAGPIANSAKLLGMPTTCARYSINALHSWARSRPDPREFETALRELADELDAAPQLIDYQRRREALSDWCIQPATWRLLLQRLDPKPSPGLPMDLGDRKRQTASIWVWARVTQGEYLLAPHPIHDELSPEAHRAWRNAATAECARYQAGQARPVLLRLKGLLDEYAHALAVRIDLGHPLEPRPT